MKKFTLIFAALNVFLITLSFAQVITSDPTWVSMYDSTAAPNGLEPHATAVDANGNVYVGGLINYSNTDYCLAKFNSLGIIQWTKTYNSGAYDRIEGLVVDGSNNVIVTGTTNCPNDCPWDYANEIRRITNPTRKIE